MEEEIWKDIPNYEGLYKVSDCGRVRSLGNDKSRKEKLLKAQTVRGGYLLVSLSKDGKPKWFQVHRLVYMTFNGEIPDGLQVNHINEVKDDNRLENLNLLTCKENSNFGTRNERVARANTNGKKSKPVVGCDAEGNIVVSFPSTREAERQGYNHRNVSSCCRGKLKRYKGLYWHYLE